uniref:Uncharacterized protein n=1 Tax=Arundo donax TaxID=35708 RepID=A0A0A9HRR4_ARUDO
MQCHAQSLHFSMTHVVKTSKEYTKSSLSDHSTSCHPTIPTGTP